MLSVSELVLVKMGFEEFCSHSSFWNASGFSDNSTYPEFTKCFRSSVPVWLPCGWLWLTLPFNVYLYQTSTKPKLAVTAFNMSKLILDLILVVLTVMDLLRQISEDNLSFTQPNVVIISGLINTVTYSLAAVYTQLDRLRGSITSTSLYVFWLLKVIFNVIDFYTRILQHNYEDHLFRFILFYTIFGILLVQLILHSFAETPGESRDLGQNVCPEGNASILNLLYFWWMNTIIMKAYRKPLTERDLWNLMPQDQSSNVVDVFERNWRKELMKAYHRNSKERTRHVYDIHQSTSANEKTPLLDKSLKPMKILIKQSTNFKGSLLTALVNSFGLTYLLSLWFKFISDVLQFAGPILIGYLISYADDRDDKPAWKGYLPVIAIFISSIVQTVFYHQNCKLGMSVGMRVRCSLVSAIYKKALTMDSSVNKDMGRIVSLMSVDCQHLQDLFSYLSTLMSVPLQVAIGIYLLWDMFQISCLAGLAVLLLMVPLNSLVVTRQLHLTGSVLALKGERIKIMNQILNGIKVLKMYAWEPCFKHQASVIRRCELDKLLKIAYLQGIATFGWLMVPFLVSFTTFATYIYLDPENNILTARKAFVALAVFNVLRLPINMLAQTISALVQSRVSLRRVHDFLSSGDLEPHNVEHVYDTDYAVKVQRGTFSWDQNSSHSTLTDINLTVREGQLVAVVGHVGAGKSSLLSAILGELLKIDGCVALKGSVAYVSQEAWIQNATMMDNILFGKTFMQKKYRRVLEACALNADLDHLPGRDLTEIGEKGINLSGGQKQRVSLARAVYSNSDVYLMDDPLSAVDAHVGKHIFENVIGNKGLLKNKTRIFVTHGIQWLPMVDNIIVLRDGKITETGSYEHLMKHDGPFAQFLKQYFIEENYAEDDPEIEKIKTMILEQVETVTSDGFTSDELTSIRKQKPLKPKQIEPCVKGKQPLPIRLTHDESTHSGQIKWSVYRYYCKAIGCCTSAAIVLIFSLYHGISVYSNFWLSFWTHANNLYSTNHTAIGVTFTDKTNYYVLVYGILGVCQAILVLIYAMLTSVRMVEAAGRLHSLMLDRMIRAPMEFFDTTPTGRIINRFSSDMETIDTTLPLTFRITINSLYLAITTVIVICINTPLIFTVVLPVLFLYGVILRFYLPTSRQLKRLESVHRSPIFNHFSETVAGASVIRAYRATERFINESLRRLDRNIVYYYAYFNSARWLGVRLELLGDVLVLSVALLSIFSGLDGPLVGLSVVYAIQATYILNLLVMNLSDLQSNIVSVERIKEYTEIQTEGAWRQGRKPVHWPQKGDVVFRDFTMRYQQGTDLVLKGINLRIKHGEKIGIVGRTGAGKSSLVSALFRLANAAQGEIILNGVAINTIGLHDLREKITILPQDPVLFAGSLRINLDPYCCYGDEQLWMVLQQSQLKDTVLDLPSQLDFQCGEGGQNLSVGQRQLVCLSRALLRRTKLLVLDEATASVDLGMDEMIQQTIFREFKECTVLCVAHRLKSVLDYDRIVVMDKGEIVEYDTPDNLLADTTTVFYNMCKEAGVVSSYRQHLTPHTSSTISEHPVVNSNHLNFDDIETIPEETEQETGSEKSFNGCSSYSGQSGHEASGESGQSGHDTSGELSNGIGKKYYVESSSADSVRFGDVTIVTPLQIPHGVNIVTPQQISQNEEEDSKGDNCIEEPEFMGNNQETQADNYCQPLESSLSGSESKGSSDRTEYYSADSHVSGESTGDLQSHVDDLCERSSGEETLLASNDVKTP